MKLTEYVRIAWPMASRNMSWRVHQRIPSTSYRTSGTGTIPNAIPLAMFAMAALVVLGSSLTGCAVLPDELEPEIYHESHITQHEPFDTSPTNFGRNVAAASLNWERGPVELRVEDGYSFHGNDGCGSCPREVFRATLGYKIPLRRAP